jgi:hypothetical protein
MKKITNKTQSVEYFVQENGFIYFSTYTEAGVTTVSISNATEHPGRPSRASQINHNKPNKNDECKIWIQVTRYRGF